MNQMRALLRRLVAACRRPAGLWRQVMLRAGAVTGGVRLIYGRGLVVDQVCSVQGQGTIILGDLVRLGFKLGGRPTCPVLLQPRTPGAVIRIGTGTTINNGVEIIARIEVSIGSDCLIGQDCMIFDSDFHGVSPLERRQNGLSRPVVIEENVWIGARAMILKGVRIGRDTVVAAGSVVTKDIAAGSIVAGNPARPVGRVNG